MGKARWKPEDKHFPSPENDVYVSLCLPRRTIRGRIKCARILLGERSGGEREERKFRLIGSLMTFEQDHQHSSRSSKKRPAFLSPRPCHWPGEALPGVASLSLYGWISELGGWALGQLYTLQQETWEGHSLVATSWGLEQVVDEVKWEVVRFGVSFEERASRIYRWKSMWVWGKEKNQELLLGFWPACLATGCWPWSGAILGNKWTENMLVLRFQWLFQSWTCNYYSLWVLLTPQHDLGTTSWLR